jgi:pyridoxal/pyridoxine/pyridoxamine kinase
MAQYSRKEKSIRDLELMAKKLKRKIAEVEKMPFSSTGSGELFAGILTTLVVEYRMLKRDIVELDLMKEI